MTRFQQKRKGLDKFAAKILQATTSLRLVYQFGGGWRCRFYADFFQRGAAFVEQPNRKRRARLLDGSGRGHNIDNCGWLSRTQASTPLVAQRRQTFDHLL